MRVKLNELIIIRRKKRAFFFQSAGQCILSFEVKLFRGSNAGEATEEIRSSRREHKREWFN